MITSLRRAAALRDDESGMGLLTVMLFVGVVTTLTVAISGVVIANTQATGRDRQALGALSTAEAGVAQAVQEIRGNPPGFFSCHEPAPNAAPSGKCLTNPAGWTSSASPEKVAAGGGSCTTDVSCYAVWISTLANYNPLSSPVNDAITGTLTAPHTVQYRIHSTGVSGGGPAARSVIVDVSATLAGFPLGVFSDSIDMNGTPAIHHESVFTLDCVGNRSKITFDTVQSNSYNGYDWASDEPQAVHSASYISSSGSACSTASASIHTPSAPCNAAYPFDQDLAGGALSSSDTACFNSWTSPLTHKTYATTSSYTLTDLDNAGFRPQGLTPSEYDALKQQAQADGTYNPSNVSAALSAVSSSTAVLYVDDADLTLGPGDIPSRFFRADNSTNGGTAPTPGDLSSCPSLDSLIIVVRNNDIMINSFGGQSGDLVASIFVPEGTYGGHGNAPILGTIFAQSFTLRGTHDFYLDQCFVNNPPSMLLDLKQVRYHEVDTTNVQ